VISYECVLTLSSTFSAVLGALTPCCDTPCCARAFHGSVSNCVASGANGAGCGGIPSAPLPQHRGGLRGAVYVPLSEEREAGRRSGEGEREGKGLKNQDGYNHDEQCSVAERQHAPNSIKQHKALTVGVVSRTRGSGPTASRRTAMARAHCSGPSAYSPSSHSATWSACGLHPRKMAVNSMVKDSSQRGDPFGGTRSPN